ncbi:MAG TPA: DtxR family transcriptional regulator [Firmicutes bacterium]|nr:DtxR family transcriptional regulator [Bacillota bacterium]
MKLYESSEDYLEQILVLTNEKGQIRSIDIVESMNFSKPSVSVAMKKLRENGYIEIDSKGYIKLTSLGEEAANKTYERHLVLSSFFEKIGVSEENALKDACRVEHDLSDETFNALKKHIETMK